MFPFYEKQNTRKMSKSNKRNTLLEYKRRVLRKKSRLLKGVVEMNHDDFEALLQIFDLRLRSINEAS